MQEDGGDDRTGPSKKKIKNSGDVATDELLHQTDIV